MQAELSIETCEKCQQLKRVKTLSGQLLPKIIAELKLWNSLHIYLISPYDKLIIKQHPCGTIIKKDVSLTYIKMIDPATGWFNFFKVPFLTSMRQQEEIVNT